MEGSFVYDARLFLKTYGTPVGLIVSVRVNITQDVGVFLVKYPSP